MQPTRQIVVYMRQFLMRQNKHKILRNYATPSGKVPFLEWLNALKDPVTRLRIRRRLDRIELGHLGDCEPVGDKRSQKNDIKTAKMYWHELKERSDE
jgi:putative component of toxin-antitoxin plasmid stabilization module